MKTILLILCACFAQSSVNAQGTLLVGNKDDNTLSFIDPALKKVTSTIPVGAGPHEVAVSVSGKWAAVANYGNRQQTGHSISIVDVARRQVIKEIELNPYLRPHGMEFINDEEVLVTSEAAKVLLRVNIHTGLVSEVVKTDQLASHMVTYAPKNQSAYVSNINSGTVSVVDVKENKLIRHIPLQPGVEGLHVSPDGKELWVANQKTNVISVISTQTLSPVDSFPAKKIAYRVGFLPNGKYAVVSNGGEGNISIYDVSAKKLVKEIDFTTDPAKPPVPGGITASADSKWLFVCSTGMNQVVMIDTSNWTIIARIDTGRTPDGIYFSTIN